MAADRIIKVETLPAVQQEFKVPVGDADIADDTLIGFELIPNPVPGEQDSKADR